MAKIETSLENWHCVDETVADPGFHEKGGAKQFSCDVFCFSTLSQDEPYHFWTLLRSNALRVYIKTIVLVPSSVKSGDMHLSTHMLILHVANIRPARTF